MSLTSWPLLVGVVLVALLAVASVPLSWDRWRRGRVLVRTGLVLLATITTLFAVGVFVNAQAGFFPTFSSLFAQRAVVQIGQGGAAVGLTGSSALPTDDAALRGVHRPGHGVVLRVQLAGGRSGISRDAAVYLPDAYFAPGWEQVRFPVLELLSGSPGSPAQLLRQLNLAAALDSAMHSRLMAPTVVVIPDTNGSTLVDRECVDAADGVADDTYLAMDVPDSISTRFRVLPTGNAWALMGLSTGGYCSVNLALRHPDRFSTVVSLSGYFHTLTDPTTGPLFGSSPVLRHENDPTWRVTHLPLPPLRMWLSAGTGEPTELRDMRTFAALLHSPVQVSTVTLPNGGHNFPSWRAALPAAFGFVSASLPAARVTPGPAGQVSSGTVSARPEPELTLKSP